MADLRNIGFEIIGQLVEISRQTLEHCKSSYHLISASRQMCFPRLAIVTRRSSEVMCRWWANSAIKSAMLLARLCPAAAGQVQLRHVYLRRRLWRLSPFLFGPARSSPELDHLSPRRAAARRGRPSLCPRLPCSWRSLAARPQRDHQPALLRFVRMARSAPAVNRLACLSRGCLSSSLLTRVRGREAEPDRGWAAPISHPKHATILHGGNSIGAREVTAPVGSSEQVSRSSEPISVAVTERVAARRLGLSVDTLRRDRRTGHLGIPYIKLGEGKRGLVRYDLVDLDKFLEGKKRRTPPPAPQPPVHEPAVQQATSERDASAALPEPCADEPPSPRRSLPPRTMWEALAETALAEPEDDPFAAAGRAAPRRQGSGYWGH